MAKVSFIIGTHNGSLKLHDCFLSILNQTYKDYEIIVCNDASNDDTANILNDYKLKYPNIFKVIHNENSLGGGLAIALNKCLKLASGRYIARIDDDDVCYEFRLEKQVKFLEENTDIDCVGSYIDVFDGSKVTSVRKIVLNPDINTLLNGFYAFHHPTILIKKDVLQFLNGYDTSSRCHRCEDLDLWYRFFINGFKGYNLDESLIKYHETLKDYKKRTYQSVKIAVDLRRYYRKKLKKPFYYDLFYLKTLLVSLLPNKIRYNLKKRKDY
ncbi:glycosyltransferase family 2 protein [Campylobacter sp. faydin G-140]|uniref:glycosyltransferase family 2 protein n=1 Tax=Campylobacter anatolicus TaxID=2829105 RepID=UPI001B90B2C0|nr:glycosyltransferase family 2 protein [Campylobacter anatolicus]MBR8465116.1 glycosyltransferase family 2 protein [Campylobacter anatolicus]